MPAAIVLCTNRLIAIDPAVLRRAADSLSSSARTSRNENWSLKVPLVKRVFVKRDRQIVAMTGPAPGNPVGFTFSDLTQRLLPTLVLDAYPDRAITYARAMQIV